MNEPLMDHFNRALTMIENRELPAVRRRFDSLDERGKVSEILHYLSANEIDISYALIEDGTAQAFLQAFVSDDPIEMRRIFLRACVNQLGNLIDDWNEERAGG